MLRTRLAYFSTLVAIATAPLCLPSAQADDLVGNWNFNSLIDNALNPLTYATDFGSGIARIDPTWQTSSVGPSFGVTSYAGTVLNSYNAAPAGQALALQGGNNTVPNQPNNGKWLQIEADLSDYINPILSLAMFRSVNTSGGFDNNQLSWSTDGQNFMNFGAAFDPGNTFAIRTFDLSAIDDLDRNSTVFLRFTFNGATNNEGHNRIDNIQLNALNVVPEPVGITALLMMSAMTLTRRRRA